MGFMGGAVMKRFEIKKIIASLDGIRQVTEDYPDLSGVVESMREEEDGGEWLAFSIFCYMFW